MNCTSITVSIGTRAKFRFDSPTRAVSAITSKTTDEKKNGIQWLACAYIALLFGAIGLLAAIYHRSKILISASSFPLIWFFNTNFCISFCETKKMISSDFYMKRKRGNPFFYCLQPPEFIIVCDR